MTKKRIFGFILILIFSVSLNASNCEAPISKERFDSLLKNVKLRNNDHQKYILITDYTIKECISVNQLLIFMDLIDEHKIKVSIVKKLYNSVHDIENNDQLLNNFTEHEKNIVKKSIN